LQATETKPEDGVYVWLFDKPDYQANNEEDNDAKIQREFLNCPFELGRSAASSFSEFDDLWWQRVIHNGGIGRTDEQRIGCSRKRCRQGTWGFLNTVMTVTNVNSNGYTISSMLMYAFDNRRRDGWIWKRTFPNVEVRHGLFNNGSPMQYTLEVTESNSSGQSSTNNLGSEVMLGDLVELRGVAEANVAVTDGLILTVPFSVSSPNNRLRKMIINLGEASHQWDRGNSGADPISVVFTCD